MQKVFVIDDDPTGTQAVAGVPVRSDWSVAGLREEFLDPSPACFLLANTRAVSESEATRINAEIGRNLVEAAQGRAFKIVSRSDSTLRGHFPGEVHALAGSVGLSEAPILLCPYFEAGGRVTIDDIHYLQEGSTRTPVGETEFARDSTFGYKSSNLKEWVLEKANNAYSVFAISLDEIREGRAEVRLASLPSKSVCILNCETPEDLKKLVIAVHNAEAQGKRFVPRTASSFAAAYAGVSGAKFTPNLSIDLSPNPSSSEERATGEEGRKRSASREMEHKQTGTLIVVGSYVARSGRQLQVLLDSGTVQGVELPVEVLLNDDSECLRTDFAETISLYLARGVDVCLYTSRRRVDAGDLNVGEKITRALVDIVSNVETRPRALIAKGGITSNDLAVHALGMKRGRVLGQLAPGIPVWRLGDETKWPGLVYVVFPGNVGAESTLREIVSIFRVAS
jgi:uncharacterized protein YgbK (DUF1537 family)